ncbi:MAG: hypothetical protein M5U29_07320 [Anaerolineae bacterium]|nr:hypothetical protein [Anaerolineae bacterium]
MGRGLALLGIPLPNKTDLTYLLRDEFTTAEGPPLSSPRTCEPGPGTLTLVQTEADLSISSGKLQIPLGTIDTRADIGYVGPAVSRAAGALLIYQLNLVNISSFLYFGFNSAQVLGWWNSNSANGWYISGFGAVERISKSTNLQVPHLIVAATDYQFALVLRSVGALWFIKGGAYTNWTLWWVDALDTSTPVYPALSNGSAQGTQDYLRVRQLPAPFDTDYGIAALDVNPGVSGTSYTVVANAIHDLIVTAPNPLANTCELRYRVLDDNNYWTAYFDATGAFKLDSVSGGVATNRISVAAVATAGNTYTIRVICDGTKHNCYTLSGTTWTKRGSEVNVSHQDSQTMVKPVAGVGWTLGRLTSWPRTSAAYAELDKV